MPHSETKPQRIGRATRKSEVSHPSKVESRHTVGLAPSLATQVHRYAETADTSMSKAIAALVRIGLESQENRKQEFFKKLKANLAEDDPKQQDRLVDEFWNLIVGQ